MRVVSVQAETYSCYIHNSLLHPGGSGGIGNVQIPHAIAMWFNQTIPSCELCPGERSVAARGIRKVRTDALQLQTRCADNQVPRFIKL